MLLFRVACAVFRVSSRFGILLCSRSEERCFLILSLFAFIFAPGNFTPGVTGVTAFVSVVCVDSAVRWRRNGAGGLRKIVVRLRLFDRRFLSFCGFVIRRVARAAASLRFWFGRDTGTGFLSDAVDRWRKSFRAEVRGASVCEPPQGGASARTAERRCLSLQAAAAPNIFSLYLLALPPVDNTSLPRSWKTIQNAQFTIHN